MATFSDERPIVSSPRVKKAAKGHRIPAPNAVTMPFVVTIDVPFDRPRDRELRGFVSASGVPVILNSMLHSDGARHAPLRLGQIPRSL
jgi:hypothetical protein